MNSSKESVKRKPSPIHAANFFSKWFFIWTRGVFKKGYLEKLGPDDIYEHVPKLDSKLLSNSLISYWEKEVRRKNPSLLHMIFSAFGWRFVPMCIIYSILEIMLHTFQPLFLGLFVAYFAEGQTEITKNDAYLAATGIVICSLVASLCFHPFMFFLFKTGTAIRVACAGLIYRKCLRSSVTSDNSGMSGFAISVLSTDLPQFDTTFYFVHDLWKGPIEACVFGYVMYTEIGWPAIVGIAAIALFIPLQAWAAKATAKYRHRFSEYGDERVKLMNEIITAIQVIKMYAWEKSFARLISSVRKKEIHAIRGSLNIYSAMQCTNMISKFALFLSLIAYVYTGDVITARKVFIISSYYDALNESLLHFWPLSVTTWAETFVCARRIQTFLMQSEDPADGGIENFAADIEKSEKANFSGRVHNPNASEKSVILQNLSASWDREDVEKRRNHISDITFHIRPGQFVGIVGNVGAGKTTLLTAILGELEIAKGSMEVNGRISYAPQEAWIFEASIRDNICFVEPYDAQRYRDVVQACELERDLQLLPYGDSTIVGERGISLSGGQKARISLARAVYRQADIYIFDDPLSAVDAKVAKRLLSNCFQDYLSTKIRLMVTHRVYNLKEADWIILLEAGTIEVQGTYEVLEQKISKRLSLTQEQVENRPKLMHSESVMVKATAEEESEQIELPSDTGLERKEQQMQGSVRFQIYAAYFRALRKPWLIFLIFLMFILARACQALMDVFIARWATWEESQPQEHETTNEFSTKRMQIVIIYTMLMLGTLLLYIVRTFGFFFICLAISLRLHDYLFNGIIRARMRFFNTNPSGRILNRFSSDIANIDITLPQTMLDSYSFYVNIIAVLAIVAFANYWLLIPEFIVISLLYFCRGLYIRASRSLKRIESMTRSPVYTHTNQTFQGLTTIRALNATSHLDNEFHSHQNTNTSALFLFVSVNRAFAFWTDLICVLYILAVTFSFLIIEKDFYSGDVGLAITQSMTLVIMCQWGVRQTAEMENNMTSVERVMEYVELPPEPPLETDPSLKLLETWPSSGEVQFRDLVLRYVEQGEPVLKGLNFSINSKEKIGIVGRTGAGKSSIIQAIFRLALNEGSILIDGIDINTLGLHDLRSRISIIPQDPVLFSGTLRYNLDPLAEKADEELWRALEDVKLKRYVSSLEGGLNCRMHDGGSNFSMGQRQLVCMARAILRHNKLLIMDEATANVDPETDILIQQTIHTNFHHCTVLTIAHRLNTVMDNDKVMVIDAGQVVEFGHPYDLLRNTDGFLYKLVQNTGRLTSEMLHHIAEKSYKKRVANG
ncbi:probable multidrug resistance-associated protein lethal(2)03659 [Anastrepha obliqua]|uniref:probable multidrug resistance-associated protein lethal(2)03659 n=1 Tax=Anastrepha obliqua TaxID=95512 RepID=UPI00240A037C|nr:probable multidrug resistance-associated protein lethal(2)03659 [Anastrepha obliqua]